jgi:two-component system response regulator VanR
MTNILIIEDEQKIREILYEFLTDYGYRVTTAADGIEGLEKIKHKAFDLVLLDIMMPKIDGFLTLSLIRQVSDVPVIIITALEDEESQMRGFDLKADDYISKPFSVNLLIRRCEAVLRRQKPNIDNIENTENTVLKSGEVTLDTTSAEVKRAGVCVPVTYKEYELIKLLLEHKNRVFSREFLLDTLWGMDFFGDEKVVNNHIMRIRKKLGEDFIVTVRGLGYKLYEEK